MQWAAIRTWRFNRSQQLLPRAQALLLTHPLPCGARAGAPGGGCHPNRRFDGRRARPSPVALRGAPARQSPRALAVRPGASNLRADLHQWKSDRGTLYPSTSSPVPASLGRAARCSTGSPVPASLGRAARCIQPSQGVPGAPGQGANVVPIQHLLPRPSCQTASAQPAKALR